MEVLWKVITTSSTFSWVMAFKNLLLYLMQKEMFGKIILILTCLKTKSPNLIYSLGVIFILTNE